MTPTENATVDAVIAAQVRNYHLFLLPGFFLHVQHISLVLTPMFLRWLFLVQPLSFRHTPTVHCSTDHAFSLYHSEPILRVQAFVSAV